MTAKSGDRVRVHYTGKLTDGEVFDSSRAREPIEFTIGAGEVIAGFETAVAGLEPGGTRQVTIPSEQAYGPHKDELKLEVGRSDLPENMDVAVGQQLQLQQGERQFVVRVAEITEEQVVLDANHPLAGQDLTFDLELVEIV
jgi:peptidylprolyl isomerase